MNFISANYFSKAAVFFVLLYSAGRIYADRERPNSIQEMEVCSELIADGHVTDVSKVETKETPYNNGPPVLRNRYQADFCIDNLIKGNPENLTGQKPDQSIKIEFWHTDDLRSRGEVVPMLEKGQFFRLFGETVSMDEHGVTIVNVNTGNAVRPEALKSSNPQNISPPKVGGEFHSPPDMPTVGIIFLFIAILVLAKFLRKNSP